MIKEKAQSKWLEQHTISVIGKLSWDENSFPFSAKSVVKLNIFDEAEDL